MRGGWLTTDLLLYRVALVQHVHYAKRGSHLATCVVHQALFKVAVANHRPPFVCLSVCTLCMCMCVCVMAVHYALSLMELVQVVYIILIIFLDGAHVQHMATCMHVLECLYYTYIVHI